MIDLIELMMAAGRFEAVPGQVVITGGTSWTVPAGVYTISMLCVQPGGDGSSTGTQVTVAGVVVCRALNGARIGDGGGNGGIRKLFTNADGFNSFPGGGGAGGYAGDGGRGGGENYDGSGNGYHLSSAGSGGGGGGGNSRGDYPAGDGGGVGLLGQGASGGVSTDYYNPNGSPGSGGSGRTYGGGSGNVAYAQSSSPGGALAYRNNIAVSPGQVLSLVVPPPGTNAGAGAIRILWGGARSYPSNAGNL